MFDWIADPSAWVALATLTMLEIVLGIDNIVFISILAGRLPEEDRPRARRIGLALAMFARLALLFSISWLAKLEATLLTVADQAISGRDLVLIVGGLFLLAKSTLEIHHRFEEASDTIERRASRVASRFGVVLAQIVMIDVVFSLDSVITAVAMVPQVSIMVTAVVISVGVMIVFVNAISAFIDRHPTFKILALAFLVLIGVVLVADGFDQHIPRGYIYFAMAFAAGVEAINSRLHPRA
ncbi:MAG: TerC family protein [Planctomycetes bacterium]|nr:TerC family protein [Planctomycetota bacterium]